MILPGDETPKKPDDPDDEVPWLDSPEDDPPGVFDEESDPNFGGKIQVPAPPGWRKELLRELQRAVHELEAIEDPAADFDPPDPPDLFTFFSELAALRNEMLQSGAMAAGDTGHSGGAAMPPASVLALLHLHDQFMASGNAAALAVLANAMHACGFTPIATAGRTFDAESMTTDDPVSGKPKVVSELAPGFRWTGKVLRRARVSLR